MALMGTGLERTECFGPIHNGVDTVLVSQIGDSKRQWCFRCLAKERMEGAAAAPAAEPQITQKARNGSGAMRARIHGEFRESQSAKKSSTTDPASAGKFTDSADGKAKMNEKVCGYCHKKKPESEFDESTRFPGKLQGTCRECKGRARASEAKRSQKPKRVSHEKAQNGATPIAHSEGLKRVEPIADGARAKVLGHSHQLLSIALLGPREQDHDFIRALCAGILEDTLTERGVPRLDQVASA